MKAAPIGSESFRKLNPHLFGGAPAQPAQPAKKRIRQDSKPLLNKLENEWLAKLQNQCPKLQFYAQAIRFKLGNGVWYKPDILCFDTFEVWEVKGPFAHRGGFENLKIAAHEYHKFTFYLVWKENGQWLDQLILP